MLEKQDILLLNKHLFRVFIYTCISSMENNHLPMRFTIFSENENCLRPCSSSLHALEWNYCPTKVFYWSNCVCSGQEIIIYTSPTLPPFWKFRLSFIYFFKFFGLTELTTPAEINIPSVGRLYIFAGTELSNDN